MATIFDWYQPGSNDNNHQISATLARVLRSRRGFLKFALKKERDTKAEMLPGCRGA
jgi:hypothetical protein